MGSKFVFKAVNWVLKHAILLPSQLPADMRGLQDYPVQRSFQPVSEEDADYPIPNVYSRKKQRPASSISEVLEEMERQRKAKGLPNALCLKKKFSVLLLNLSFWKLIL